MRTSYLLSDFCSIIVTYQINVENLTEILKCHKDNFQQIIIVNNTPEIDLSKYQSKQITIINNQGNIGLSAALNVGILEAKKQGAEMVALFDQDTLLPDDFMQNMLKHMNAYQGVKKTRLIFAGVF